MKSARRMGRMGGAAGSLLVLLVVVAGVGAGFWRPAPRQAVDESQIVIEASDGAVTGGFGGAVAVDGDTLAVGAQYAAVDGQSGAGKVYLYARDAQSPNVWSETRILHRDPPAGARSFGLEVALKGDTLVVGAPLQSGNVGFAEGEAYVYERDQGGAGQWGLVTPLADETEAVLRYFGGAVAVGDDLIAVGAWGADGSRGKVYLYSRSAGWARVQSLENPAAAERDSFGMSVALDGDTVVVGAPYVDASTTMEDSGAAYVFERNHGGPDQWGLAATLAPELQDSGAAFGREVAIEGDRIIVTAPSEDRYIGGQFDAQAVGAAYVYERDEGGPGLWGRAATLRPSDGELLEQFGRSLAMTGERAWLGATDSGGTLNQPGIIYAYERQGDGSWAEQAPIRAFDAGLSDRFGLTLSVSGDTLAAGAPERLPEAATYVIDVSPAAAANAVFMPVSVNGWFATTGVLADGGSLESPEGAILGVVEGTLTSPLDATIAVTSRPPDALPGQFLTRGEFFLVGARTLTTTPVDKPVLVGLPVPAAADTGKLAVAALVPDRLLTEQDITDSPTRSWTTAPGWYDPDTNLFITTVSALLPEGVTLVLFEHDANTPLPPPAAQRSGQQAVVFNVRCDPAATHTGVCEPAYYALVADELKAAHDEFVDTFDFRRPRLVSQAGRFTGPDKKPQLNTIAYHGAVIAEKPCLSKSGDPIAGQYSYHSLQLLVCIDPAGSSEDLRHAIRHEFFHAIQASYPNLGRDRHDSATSKRTYWLVEGTAAMAEKSGYLLLRSPAFPLRRATDPLLSIESDYEYRAQDFWVYTGLEDGQANHELSYLRPIFEAGGTPEHANAAMKVGEAYWSWAKNQIFEHHEPMIDAFDTGPCEFDPAAFDGQAVKIMEYPDQAVVEGTLEPLTSAIVEIRVANSRNFMPVGADVNHNPQDLRYKVYELVPKDCQDVPDGARILENIPAGGLRYVVIANTGFTDSFDYVVEVD